MATAIAFIEAMTLATTPAPAGAAELNVALIAQLQSSSDLFLLEMLAMWNQFLQADQDVAQQLTADLNQRVTTATAAYEDIQIAWARLAERCGVAVRLVDLPRPIQG